MTIDDVADAIRRSIDRGQIPLGGHLRSVRDQAKTIHASTRTVNLAYQRLAQQGLVERDGQRYRVCTAAHTLERAQRDLIESEVRAFVKTLVRQRRFSRHVVLDVLREIGKDAP